MSETRYAFVAREIASRIASGQHPVGSTLPNEVGLALQFGVSRATVRSALRELQQLGLVSRRRNAGTRVESVLVDGRSTVFHQSLGSIEDLVQYAAETRRIVLGQSEIAADRSLARTIGVQPGRRLLHLRATRRSHDGDGGRPICWMDIYLDAAFAPLGEVIPGHDGLIAALIEERFGRRIAEIGQSLKATGVPGHMAGALEAEPGSHALAIVRRYLDAAGSILLATVSLHPADRFQYDMRLARRPV